MNSMEKQKIERENALKSMLIPDPNIGEKSIFTGLSVLKKFADQSRNTVDKIGPGIAQILQNTSNKRYRLLVRSSSDLNFPLLNCYIFPSLKRCDRIGFVFEGVNHSGIAKKENYYIALINESSASNFQKCFLQAAEANKHLFESQKNN